MTEHGDDDRQLSADVRTERWVLWKGVLAMVLVLVVAYARQRWWV
ncbi:hypothetical protein [Serinicoccus kebangsaanensis]|nr:hypothetical protein [Serinicoccus kebangsaanensis]